MTVPEPTPDHASRGSLVRRAGFYATATGLTVAFALSLAGIASTRGSARPETQAAVAAAAQRHSDASDTGATTFRRGHCRHGDRQRGGSSSGTGGRV
jgi:hypothetical protein